MKVWSQHLGMGVCGGCLLPSHFTYRGLQCNEFFIIILYKGCRGAEEGNSITGVSWSYWSMLMTTGRCNSLSYILYYREERPELLGFNKQSLAVVDQRLDGYVYVS
jgi:hypothetical protein